MRGKKIIIISIIINILTIGIIYNLVRKDYLNNEKIIVKAMTGTEYENSIKSLNTSHEDYAKNIEEGKKKIASAITDMGVITSDEETLENMANNIRNISTNKDASSISYDNTQSALSSTNVQGAVDEIQSEVGELNDSLSDIKTSFQSGHHLNFLKIGKTVMVQSLAWVTLPYTIPEGYRPTKDFYTTAYCANGKGVTAIVISSNGTITDFGQTGQQVLFSASYFTNDE